MFVDRYCEKLFDRRCEMAKGIFGSTDFSNILSQLRRAPSVVVAALGGGPGAELLALQAVLPEQTLENFIFDISPAFQAAVAKRALVKATYTIADLKNRDGLQIPDTYCFDISPPL